MSAFARLRTALLGECNELDAEGWPIALHDRSGGRAIRAMLEALQGRPPNTGFQRAMMDAYNDAAPEGAPKATSGPGMEAAFNAALSHILREEVAV